MLKLRVKVASTSPEVVLVEDQVLGEVGFLAEDEPADARVDEPELVAGDVDRAHLLEPEVPLRVRVEEGPDEAAGGAVDVDRHVVPAVLLQLHQVVVDPADVVGMAGEGGAEDGGDADRVLVDLRGDVVGADRVLALLQRHHPLFDVEVAAELFPDHVHVAAEDEVRFVDRFARRFPPFLPFPLQREGAEHDRLGGALAAGAGRLAGGVEEVGEHADAALLDLGRDRILGVIDEVAVVVLGDQPLGLRLHPGGDEGGQVAVRVALQLQFLFDQALRVERRHPLLRERPVGGVLGQEPGPVEAGLFGGGGVIFRHRSETYRRAQGRA